MADPYLMDPTTEAGPSWTPEPPQQMQFQPPTVPEPWTAADDQKLLRLTGSVKALEDQGEQGILHPLEVEREVGQINQQRQGLLQRQQQDQARKVADQQQTAMHANAQMKGMELQDENADHQAFKLATDPETGAKFFNKGKWAQYTPPDSVDGEADVEPAAQPELKANPDGTHTMTIYNGAQKSEVTFAPNAASPTGWSMAGRQDYDANGQPIQSAAPTSKEGNADGSLSDAQLSEIDRKATERAGRQPPQFWNGRPNQQYLEWMKAREAIRNQMQREQTNLNLSRVRNDAVVAEHQRQEAVRKAAKPGVQDLAKQFDFTAGETARMLKSERDDLADANKAGAELVGGGRTFKDDNGKEFDTTPTTTWSMMPAKARQKEAEDRVMDTLRRMKGGAAHPDHQEETPPATPPQTAPRQPAITNENPLGIQKGEVNLSGLMDENRKIAEELRRRSSGNVATEPKPVKGMWVEGHR